MMDRLGSLCKVGLEALHLINDDDDGNFVRPVWWNSDSQSVFCGAVRSYEGTLTIAIFTHLNTDLV